MKISLLFANSMKKFFDFKNKNIRLKREKQKDTLLKYADFSIQKLCDVRDFYKKI
jgi:hypothetical protein